MPALGKRYSGLGNGRDDVFAVAVDRSGNVVVTGSSDANGACYGCNEDYYTAKYAAADGTLLWEQRYNGPARDEAHPVAGDARGNVVVLWERSHDGPFGLYQHSAVAVDCNGTVIVAGDSLDDCYTAKYAAADGALLWEQR